MENNQSKYSQLTDLLLENKKAYEEQWKNLTNPSFDYVAVLNDTYLKILDSLPFKDTQERTKFESMAETFNDYETFEAEVLRIGSRLLNGRIISPQAKIEMNIDENFLDNLSGPIPDDIKEMAKQFADEMLESHQDEMNKRAKEIEDYGFYAWVNDNIYDGDDADTVKAYILSVIKLVPEDTVKKINEQLVDRLRNPDKYEGE